MLPTLQAERQMLAIEASLVGHMKPEEGAKVIRRHTDVLKPKEEQPKRITEAFLRSGMRVVEVPAAKPAATRRDRPGRARTARRGKR